MFIFENSTVSIANCYFNSINTDYQYQDDNIITNPVTSKFITLENTNNTNEKKKKMRNNYLKNGPVSLKMTRKYYRK